VKYFLRTVIGLGLLVGGVVAISYSVHQLLQIGTCATGGPYEIARECPSGTEWLGLAIPIGVFVMLGAVFVYGSRGAPPGSDRPGDASVGLLVLWSGLFLGIGFACFWGVWGPDANPGPGGKLGGLIVGFLFVPMGAFPILAVLASKRRGKRRFGASGPTLSGSGAVHLPAATATTRGSAAPSRRSGDKLADLERLQRLREDGAIDDAEFEALKAEVMES
jgi:hypothetical protein